MHTLRQVLTKRTLAKAAPDELVLDVTRRMTSEKVGAVVILEGDRLVGIFSERDLMTRVVVAGLSAAETPVSQVMTREVVTASLEDRTGDCLAKMQRAGCRHLPVTTEGRVIAMLSRS